MTTTAAHDRSVFEQHAQTIIAMVIVALLGWGGYTLTQLQKDMAAMVVQMTSLQSEVVTLRQLNQDRYSATQAGQDWNRNRQEMDDIRSRLRAVEQKVR